MDITQIKEIPLENFILINEDLDKPIRILANYILETLLEYNYTDNELKKEVSVLVDEALKSVKDKFPYAGDDLYANITTAIDTIVIIGYMNSKEEVKDNDWNRKTKRKRKKLLYI